MRRTNSEDLKKGLLYEGRNTSYNSPLSFFRNRPFHRLHGSTSLYHMGETWDNMALLASPVYGGSGELSEPIGGCGMLS